jgi:ABC-type phosphate/phosphonate transport system substrate-binding protein
MRLTFCWVTGLVLCLVGLAYDPPSHACAGSAPLKVGMAQSFFHDMSKPLIESVTDPFVAIMRETAGLTGELVIGGDAFAVAQQLKDNKLQMSLFHGFEFAWVQQKYPELRPLMITVNAKQPVRVYVLVPRDSAAKSFADLKGKNLAIPKRTKEYCRYLVERLSGGSKTFFGLVVPSLNVETALDDLVQKKHHAVVVDAAGLEFYKDLNPGRFDKLRVLTQSEVFPPMVIAYRPGSVKDEILAKARSGLAAAHKTERFREMEKTWNITSIEPVPDNFAQTLAASLKTFPMLEARK